ncbi:MAG: FKBP-type peptidyl-prolyl cis-trans isomerase [Gammaproteobacteria bacterium]
MLLLLIPMATVAIAADAFQITPQGLLYKDLKPGSGNIAAVGDVATMHFTGWLDDAGSKGKELYNTRRQGKPVAFVIGTDRVMQGWNEGVIGMRPGGKRLLKVPPSLGYGSRGVEDIIPPNARLIFIIDLIDVEKHPAH